MSPEEEYHSGRCRMDTPFYRLDDFCLAARYLLGELSIPYQPEMLQKSKNTKGTGKGERGTLSRLRSSPISNQGTSTRIQGMQVTNWVLFLGWHLSRIMKSL